MCTCRERERERERLHLFQPPRADQVPDPQRVSGIPKICDHPFHRAFHRQYTHRHSVTYLGTPYKSACHIKWFIVLACCPNNPGPQNAVVISISAMHSVTNPHMHAYNDVEVQSDFGQNNTRMADCEALLANSSRALLWYNSDSISLQSQGERSEVWGVDLGSLTILLRTSQYCSRKHAQALAAGIPAREL